MQHHEQVIETFTATQSERPEVLGVVVVGSVARGDERPDSDVDVYLVLTDDAHAAASAAGQHALVSYEGVAYPRGYVDIKLISPGYLAAAAERADDPTRSSFRRARVTLDRLGDLTDRVAAIAQPPADGWDRRVASYRGLAQLYGGYFLRQASERADDFGLRYAAVHFCLAAARALLAHHHRLYRGQKYLAQDLASLPDLPDDLLPAWRSVLAEPSPTTASALFKALDATLGEPPSVDEGLSRFIIDNELAWLNRTVPPEFW